MDMQKGMAIIERDDTQTKAVFIDHEVLEFARLNAQTKKRLAKAEEEQRNESRILNREEKMKARRRAYTVRTIFQVLTCGGIGGGAVWAGMVGLIHPAILIPVIMVCLSVACVRLGLWFGRMAK